MRRRHCDEGVIIGKISQQLFVVVILTIPDTERRSFLICHFRKQSSLYRKHSTDKDMAFMFSNTNIKYILVYFLTYACHSWIYTLNFEIMTTQSTLNKTLSTKV